MALLTRRELRTMAIEAIVVVFSILLALSVDSWRSERAERRAAVEAANGVNHEVARNLAELEAMRADVTRKRERLSTLGDSLKPRTPFASMMGSFSGFRTSDLSRSAWERASGAAIANRLDAAYLRDAFRVYEADEMISGLDDRITTLGFGETFYLPERAHAAWLISLAIMQQQLDWIDEAIPLHRRFLQTHAPALLDSIS